MQSLKKCCEVVSICDVISWGWGGKQLLQTQASLVSDLISIELILVAELLPQNQELKFGLKDAAFVRPFWPFLFKDWWVYDVKETTYSKKIATHRFLLHQRTDLQCHKNYYHLAERL